MGEGGGQKTALLVIAPLPNFCGCSQSEQAKASMQEAGNEFLIL